MPSRHVPKSSTCAKQNVVIRLQVEYMLHVISLEINGSSVLSLTLNKLFGKTFLVRNFYFACCGTGSLHCLTTVTSKGSGHSSIVWRSYR